MQFLLPLYSVRTSRSVGGYSTRMRSNYYSSDRRAEMGGLRSLKYFIVFLAMLMSLVVVLELISSSQQDHNIL